MEGKTYVAKVVSVKDIHSGGIIKVVNPDINAGSPIVCYAANAPTGGGGAGFFAVPGKHSNVLITEAYVSETSKIWVWLSCVYLPTNNAVGKDGTPLSTDDIHINRPEGADNSPYFSYDNPDPVDVYQDNFLPEGEVWKSKGGHSMSMYSKNTSERSKHGITIRSTNGKVLVLDDALENAVNGLYPRRYKSLSSPSRYEDVKGNKVILSNEDGDRLQITEGKVQLVSYGSAAVRSSKGIDISVENPSSKGDIDISNNGVGSINIESHSEASITAPVINLEGAINLNTVAPLTLMSPVFASLTSDQIVAVTSGQVITLTSSQAITLTSTNGAILVNSEASPVPHTLSPGELVYINYGLLVNGSPVLTWPISE